MRKCKTFLWCNRLFCMGRFQTKSEEGFVSHCGLRRWCKAHVVLFIKLSKNLRLQLKLDSGENQSSLQMNSDLRSREEVLGLWRRTFKPLVKKSEKWPRNPYIKWQCVKCSRWDCAGMPLVQLIGDLLHYSIMLKLYSVYINYTRLS